MTYERFCKIIFWAVGFHKTASDPLDSTYHIKIFKPGADSLDHVLALGVGRRARVQGRMESRAHLLDARLELLALEERYEHCFVDLVTLNRKNSIKIVFTIMFIYYRYAVENYCITYYLL